MGDDSRVEAGLHVSGDMGRRPRKQAEQAAAAQVWEVGPKEDGGRGTGE